MWAIYQRELRGYFYTPIGYVFMVVFLMLAGIFTFYLGDFYAVGQADLEAFFTWHPWLYLFLMPAVAMRLWAEERRGGTLELLLTLPVSTLALITGKYLAALSFTVIALFLTFPIWITVNYLGDPDNGIIIAGYVASIFLAAGLLAIGCAVSALTRNQVVAFVVGMALCFVFLISGFPMVLDFFAALHAPQWMLDTITSFSLLSRFEDLSQGVIRLDAVMYFMSLIVFFLGMNLLILHCKR